MEQRDYIMRQIEQLGQVLAQMLARLLGLKQQGSASLRVEELRLIYKNELDIDLEELVKISEDDIIMFLKTKNKYFEHHLEIIADILHATAENYFNNHQLLNDGKNLLRKSVKILEYIQTSERIYSIDRIQKIQKIKNILNN
jgi:hypothetical protein